MPVFALTAGSLGDIIATAGFVVKVTQVLCDSRGSSAQYRELMDELQSLHRVLILIEDAVQHCEHTPLVTAVYSEVNGCRRVMRAWLDNINKYRKPLSSTGIGGMWGKIWWALWESDELEVLRKALCTRNQRLTMLLAALTSNTLTDCGNEMQASRISMNEIAGIVRQASNPLRQNPENMVWAVDIEYLTSVIVNDPGNALNWYQLGRTYMVGRNYNPAYEAYEQAVFRDGRNPSFWNAVGELYYSLNQIRDAFDAYSRGIHLNPYMSELWFNLGRLYETPSGVDASEAIAAYSRARELDPSNLVVSQRLKLLKNRLNRRQPDNNAANGPSATNVVTRQVDNENERSDHGGEVEQGRL